MVKLFRNFSNVLKSAEIQVRPCADDGLWLAFFLPLCVITSALKHPIEASLVYKQCSVISAGFVMTSLIFMMACSSKKKIAKASKWCILPAGIISMLFYVHFGKGVMFSIFCGLLSSLFYNYSYEFIIRVFPLSFTLGEAVVVTQGLILFLFSALLNISKASAASRTVMNISTLIIQLGLIAIGLICCAAYYFSFSRKPTSFYFLVGFIAASVICLPLHLSLGINPILWIVQLILDDLSTMKMILYWSICSVIAVAAVSRQISGGRKASTVTRKIFHILACAVYLPGLLYQCSFLYLASGVVLGIFIFLELLRVLNMPPLGQRLQDGFVVFCDEKDAGVVALTPIYLLVGCSLPLWLHPSPCDVTNSAGFNLLPLMSGILSIGVGDTLASLFGSRFGKYHWSGSKKTIEGTIACILSQGLLVFLLINFGFMQTNYTQNVKISAAIISSSLVEAKTNQVDNLVLPLVMYVILV